ncbi:MAG: hypothetical protein Q9161_003396 [Pseudevernia consocians]
MAELSELQSKDPIGLHEVGSDTRTSHGREDSDSFALRQAGKTPVLRRNFSLLSMFGFSCLVLGTWQGSLITFGIGLQNGGPAGLVYSFLFTWAGTLATFTSLAELASMQVLRPSIACWLTVAGWQASIASSAYLEGVLIQNLIQVVSPTYSPKLWHGTLLCYAVLLVCIVINTLAGTKLPRIEVVLLVVYILSFFGIIVPLVYLAPHGNAHDVFATFLNLGGWGTQTLSFFVGLSGNAFAFLGADCVYHMSEEIKNATAVVPRSIVFGLIMNGSIGFGIIIATLFCIGDPNAIANTSYQYPFIAIFVQATKSTGGSAVMVALIILVGLGLDIGIMAAASRMLWSFARDKGVPGWRHISKVDGRTKIPITSVLTTTILCVLLALISIGSKVAFNDVVSLTLAALYASYFIACALLLWRRTTGSIKSPDEVDPTDADGYNLPGSAGKLIWGPWRVHGLLGVLINSFACIYLLIVWVFVFWPPTKQVTPASMNYTSLVMGAVAIFSAVYYAFWGRRTYHGPIVDTVPEKEGERRP